MIIEDYQFKNGKSESTFSSEVMNFYYRKDKNNAHPRKDLYGTSYGNEIENDRTC